MAFVEVTRKAGGKRMIVNADYIVHLEKGVNGGTYIAAVGWPEGCEVEEEIEDLERFLNARDYL